MTEQQENLNYKITVILKSGLEVIVHINGTDLNYVNYLRQEFARALDGTHKNASFSWELNSYSFASDSIACINFEKIEGKND